MASARRALTVRCHPGPSHISDRIVAPPLPTLSPVIPPGMNSPKIGPNVSIPADAGAPTMTITA